MDEMDLENAREETARSSAQRPIFASMPVKIHAAVYEHNEPTLRS